MLDAVLIQLGADDAKLAGGISAAGTQIHLTGNEIKVDPGAVLGCQDALSPKHHAVSALIQFFQTTAHKVHCELLMGLGAPGSEDFVCMMVVMIVAATGAMLIVIVVMMFVVMIVMMLMIMMMVLVLMVVIMVVMVMMMVVLVIMVMAAAGAVLVMMMVMMMLMLSL